MKKASAGVALAAGLFIAGCSTGSDVVTLDRPTTTTEKEATTTTGRVTTTTEDTSLAEMAEWVDGALPYVNDLTDQLGVAGEAAGSMDTITLEDACGDLADLAGEARDETLPVPDPEIDDVWGKALSAFEQAGRACEDGARNLDVDELNRAVDLMDQGTGYVTEATGLMGAYTE